jgi:glycerol transport system ATP-binding protein
VQTGTPEELFERPAHTFVGYFIGSPGMNVLPAEVKDNEARIAGRPLRLGASYHYLPAGERIEVGIRPEFVTVAPAGTGLLTANIERVDDLGRTRFAQVRVDGLTLAARMPFDVAVDGDQVGLVFDPAHIHVYADSHLVEGVA